MGILITIGGFFILPKSTFAASSDVIVTEIMYNPSGSDGGHEWVELYNTSTESVTITGGSASGAWRLNDGSANRTFAESAYQGSMVIEPGAFAVLVQNPVTFKTDYPDFDGAVIQVSAMNLNNTEATVGLRIGSSGDFWSQITYNKVQGADGNARTLERKGVTDVFLESVVDKGTPGANNSVNDLLPGPVCGNGICEDGENSDSCLADCPLPPAIASAGDVVINEFMPHPLDGKEWVELYLNKDSEVDLTGWKVYDNTGNSILNLSGSLTTSSRFGVFELSSSHGRLNDDGDNIVLKSSDGTVIDQVIYGKQPDNAPVPSKAGQSVARQSNGVDTDVDNVDFALSDQPTPYLANVIVQTETKSGSTSDIAPHTVAKPVIYINEFVSDPTDNEQEWVEIYNAGEVSVDLNGWTLEEGSKSKTALSGTIIPEQFKIISPIQGSLNNDGDIIFLKDEMGDIFDQVAYGNWNDGQLDDNAPVASDPASTARKFDGSDTGNPAQDFIVATLPTKNKSNSSLNDPAQLDNEAKIIINELLPDPAGDDIDEFIEIKNQETHPVNLTGWVLQDESKKRYTIAQTSIAAAGFYVVKRTQSGIALNNNTETLYLYAPDGELKDKIDCKEAKEGQSWSRFTDGWQWTSTLTPGKENVLTSANHTPKISLDIPAQVLLNHTIELDAGDSFDEDDDELSFAWSIDGQDFSGDSVKYVFTSLGAHTLHLAVSDGKEETNKEMQIEVVEKLSTSGLKNLYISEALPNPVGDDSAEWIELYYDGASPLDLAGFKLDDEEGGSPAYKIPENKIFPGQYLLFPRQETKLALNNTGDKVRLFDAQGNLIQETVYSGTVPEGLSWSRQSGGQYIWTAPTPGDVNSTTVAEKNTKTASGQAATQSMTLEQAHQADIGDKVRVSGVVSVLPGIFGTQIFYLSGSGMQIFMSKKNFPDLKVGDLVEVTGELSEAQGERRIKVANKEDIKILANNQTPHLKEVALSEINDDLVGSLLQVTGIIVSAGGGRGVLEDGGDELNISIKKSTGIDAKVFTEGEQVQVTGVLSQKTNGLELLPRNKDDIKVLSGALSGETTRETLVSGNKAGSAKNYLAVTAGGLTSILVTLGVRNRLWRMIPFSLLAGLFRPKKKE